MFHRPIITQKNNVDLFCPVFPYKRTEGKRRDDPAAARGSVTHPLISVRMTDRGIVIFIDEKMVPKNIILHRRIIKNPFPGPGVLPWERATAFFH
jgi:hypothetical protein